uniref:26.5 kDa heat shock protein, mitochondrial n=1 Tax=Elaeis guineensis var. tenera TaxID=51953 RepID=A0A6I9QEE0_ELAGV|nr:26.5 kDa heat shock protein, mitochondrial [Elaeis guineensis]
MLRKFWTLPFPSGPFSYSLLCAPPIFSLFVLHIRAALIVTSQQEQARRHQSLVFLLFFFFFFFFFFCFKLVVARMALARMCLRRTTSLLLRGRHSFPLTAVGVARGGRSSIDFGAPSSYSAVPDHRSPPKREDEKKGGEVAAATESSSTPAPRRRGLLSRHLIPFRFDSTGLGNALWQVSENLNRLLEKWAPSRLLGRMKEVDDCYKLFFEVPGLRKEDMRITVEDGFLVITGERKEEEEDDSDEEGGWYSKSYGYYNTSLLLPDDAKVEEIKAEVKDGILKVTIPRNEEKKRNIREVKIQ